MNLAKACPKPSFKRSAPKRGAAGKFSPKTIKAIFERDEYRCVKCGSNKIESVPHHIIYRSALGKGVVTNGATVCTPCHKAAHTTREAREWFEVFQIMLLEQEETK